MFAPRTFCYTVGEWAATLRATLWGLLDSYGFC